MGYNSNGEEIISFRVAKSNHKEGPFNNPSLVYGGNPYSPYETIQAEYTSTSKVLNVDTLALSQQATRSLQWLCGTWIQVSWCN